MGKSLYGTAAFFVLIAGIGVVSVSNAGHYKPAMATVSTIDRTCDFIETRTDPTGQKSSSELTDSCNSTDEWDKARDDVKAGRRKKISGSETVHFSYAAPQDGSYRTAELKFDGGDDEFYDLVAGSQFKILVDDQDPSKIRKA